MHEYLFCLFDTETTGLSPKDDRILELSIFFLTDNYTILDILNLLIKPNNLEKYIDTQSLNYKYPYTLAYQVHKIEAKVILEKGIEEKKAILQINKKLEEISSIYKFQKAVLISDNIYFDMSFLKEMYERNNEKFPFHYAGWDTNLLFYVLNINDPRPNHRSFIDTSKLYRNLIYALSKIKAIKGVEKNYED